MSINRIDKSFCKKSVNILDIFLLLIKSYKNL